VSVAVLTYHAVEDGPPPLCVPPERFAEQLDLVAAAGVAALTVSQLAAAVRDGALPERAVALTFDDGAASVARIAAPLLLERGLVATVFCVAGHLGGRNDWPSQAVWAPRLELAGAEELRELVRAGFEIGSHGTEHAPLANGVPDSVVRSELVGSRRALSEAVGFDVRSFAYPYNVRPGEADRLLAAAGYTAACIGGLELVRPGTDPLALPRIDAHYLGRARVFQSLLRGTLPTYLVARRAGARARRLLRKDYGPGMPR